MKCNVGLANSIALINVDDFLETLEYYIDKME